MGVNVFLFLIFQVGVEPWRRKRLVKGFEDKVMEALKKEGAVKSGSPVKEELGLEGERTQLPEPERGEPAAQDLIIDDALLPSEELATPQKAVNPDDPSFEIDAVEVRRKSTLESVQWYCRDLFSERQVIIRRMDLTTAALEGFGAGIVLVGAVMFFLRSR